MKKADLIVNLSLLSFSVVALLVTVFVFNRQETPSLNLGPDQKAVVAAKVVNVEEKTDSLRKALVGGQAGASGSAAIKAIALARKREFLALMNKAPEEAARLAWSPAERGQLPPDVQPTVEQVKTVAGRLDVNVIQDPVDRVPRRTVVAVTKEGERVTLHIPGEAAGRLYSSGKIVANGVAVDDQMAVTSSSLDRAKEGAFRTPRRAGAELTTSSKELAWLNPSGKILGAQSGPSYSQTSEFMLGKAAVGVVMPQCNGAVDKCTETWTTARMDQVYNNVTAAMNWWVARMGGFVSFVIDQHRQAPTGYEPINRPQSDEGLWIGDVMSKMGYSGSDYWEKVYAYDNWMRQNYKTDWAFTVFVADSNNSSTGVFPDGYMAYSYTPGPFMVITYDNDGYGISNMAPVTAHEMGHIFWALDEYPGAGSPCTETSGYLAVQNQNSQQTGCTSNVDSIMRGGTAPYANRALDQYAAGMMGFRVSGGNGIPDPINSKPKVTLDPLPSPMMTSPMLSGVAEDQAYVPPSGNPIMIGYIAKVQYRVNGGAWQDASPVSGGSFGKVTERFSLSPSFGQTPSGNQLVEVQATDRFGGISDIASATLEFQPTVTPAPIVTPTPTSSPIATPGGLCVPAELSMMISPSSQKGAAGQPVNYSITLKNNDSPGCVPVTVKMTQNSVPPGWTQSPSIFGDVILESGVSATVPVAVTPAMSATAGTYWFSERAWKADLSSGVVSQAAYVVQPGASPTVTPTLVPTPTVTPVPTPMLTPAPTLPPQPGCVTSESFSSMPMWSSSWDASWGGPANWSANGYLGATRQGVGSSVRTKVYQILPNTTYTISVQMNGRTGQSYWTEVGYKLGSYSAENFDEASSTWVLINKFDGYGTYPNGNGGAWSTYKMTVNSGGNSSVSVGFKAGLGQGNSYPGGNWGSLSICSVEGATIPTPTLTPMPVPVLTPVPTPTPVSTLVPTPTPVPTPTSTQMPTPTVQSQGGCTASCVSAVTSGNCKQGSPCKTIDQRSDALPKVTFMVNSSGCANGVTVDLSLGQFSSTAPVGDVPWGTWWSAAQINQPGTSSADWNFCNSSVCHTFNPGQTLYWRVRDSATGQPKAICSPFNGPLAGSASLRQSTVGFLPNLSNVLGASTQGDSILGEVLRLLKGLVIR